MTTITVTTGTDVATRVINYAQWASRKHYEDALERPDVREHIAKAAAHAERWDPTLVHVWSIHHAADGQD